MRSLIEDGPGASSTRFKYQSGADGIGVRVISSEEAQLTIYQRSRSSEKLFAGLCRGVGSDDRHKDKIVMGCEDDDILSAAPPTTWTLRCQEPR